MMKQTGYQYFYQHNSPRRLSERQRRNALEIANDTANPRLKNVDFLILRERIRILNEWKAACLTKPLCILDVGGRIQPYRSFFCGVDSQYVSIDLQFEGCIDVLARAEQLPFAENQFDLVLCTQVLGYLPSPEIAIREIYRVLRPQAHLILSAPSFFPEHHDEYWRFLPSSLRYLLSDFDDVRIEPEGNTWTGIFRNANVLLHSKIANHHVLKIAEATTIPLVNLLGLIFRRHATSDTRCTPNYSVLARK